MKYPMLFTIFFLVLNSSKAQSSKKLDQDTLIWNKDSLLVKEYFKAKHGSHKAIAITATTIRIHSELKGNSLLFYVEAIFSKSKSYMKEDFPYVMKHEQGHFDIAEINARRLRKLISEKDFIKVKDVIGTIQKMYDRVIQEFDKEQAAYEEGTQSGINPAKQKAWNEKIATELAELEKFSSTEIDIAR